MPSEPFAHWPTHHPHILRYLRQSFPAASPQSLEDAASAAALAWVGQPQPWLESTCVQDQRRWLCRVAWRALRGELRLKSSRVFRCTPEQAGLTRPAGQDYAMDLPHRVEVALSEAAHAHGGAEPAVLRAALEYALWTGEPDAAVARGFGVRRDALNRAKRQVQLALVETVA